MDIDNLNNAVLVWGLLPESAVSYVRDLKAMAIVPEMRPYGIGRHRVLPRLLKANVPAVYCTDNMLGLLFFKKKISRTIIVYSREEKDGVVAVSGTLYAALLSVSHGIKISLLRGEDLDYNTVFTDTDATSLCGTRFIKEKLPGSIVLPETERLFWGMLKDYEKITA